jgi:hypothetical protein
MRKVLVLVVLGLLIASASAATKGGKKHGPVQCRDSKTGAYVSVSYAKKYPGLTVCEQRK